MIAARSLLIRSRGAWAGVRPLPPPGQLSVSELVPLTGL